MYEFNYAYSEQDDNFTELSPEALITQMFDKTDEKGWLFVPGHPYRIGKDSEGMKWLRCLMKWDAGNRDELIREYDELYKALAEIAALHPELGVSAEENTAVLSGDALRVWRIHCTDLCDGTFERELERSIDKLIDREVLAELGPLKESRREAGKGSRWHLADRDPVPADEEVLLYWKYNFKLKEAIKTRYGDGDFVFDVCVRTRRLYYLMAFGAPQRLIDREAKRLAKYMVLDRFCKNCSEMELSDVYAFPLTGIRNVELVRDVLNDSDLYDVIDPENEWESAVMNWNSVYYKDAELGEELIEQFDLVTDYEGGSDVLAESLARDKELNPKGIEFSGSMTKTWLGSPWPDFIVCETETGQGKKAGRISEQDILDTLERFAAALGIEAGLAGRYMIPL